MRLASVAVLALLSSVALVGCGDDSGNIELGEGRATTTEATETTVEESDADPADREAIVGYIAGADGSIIDRVAGQCVADAVIDDISADGLDTISAGGDFDLSDFSSEDGDLMIAALDECVDIEDAAASFAEGIMSEDGLPISAEEAECAANEFAAGYDGSGSFISSVIEMDEEESGAKLFEVLGGCISDESAVNFMAAILGEQGLDDSLATCVSGHLVTELGAAGLMEAIATSGSGGNSEELESLSAEAGAACAGSMEGTLPSDIGGGLSGN